MRRPFVELADGREVPWRDLPQEFPNDIFFDDGHFDAAATQADEAGVGAEARPVLINLLFQRSAWLRQLTALRRLAAEGRLRRVVAPGDPGAVRRALGGAVDAGAVELGVAPRPVDAGWRMAIVFALKVVAHRLFRVFGWGGRGRLGGRAVRSFVEVSLTLFPEELPGSDLLVYPFPISVARQWRYLRLLRSRGLPHRLTGLPYRFGDAIRVLAGRGHRRIVILAEAEARAAARHGAELAEAGVRTLLTSDEFEAGGVALHRAFRATGARSVNVAHGTGVYCPLVAYDEFRVLSTSQPRYYDRRNPGIRYVRRRGRNTTIAFASDGPFAPQLVFIYQYSEALGMRYESAAQRRLLAELKALSEATGTPLSIKAHPNQAASDVAAVRREHGVPVFRHWGEAELAHPILLTLKSTIFFELIGVAPIFVYTDGVLAPELYLGTTLPTVTPGSMDRTLRPLLEREAWERTVREQRETHEATWTALEE